VRKRKLVEYDEAAPVTDAPKRSTRKGGGGAGSDVSGGQASPSPVRGKEEESRAGKDLAGRPAPQPTKEKPKAKEPAYSLRKPHRELKDPVPDHKKPAECAPAAPKGPRRLLPRGGGCLRRGARGLLPRGRGLLPRGAGAAPKGARRLLQRGLRGKQGALGTRTQLARQAGAPWSCATQTQNPGSRRGVKRRPLGRS